MILQSTLFLTLHGGGVVWTRTVERGESSGEKNLDDRVEQPGDNTDHTDKFHGAADIRRNVIMICLFLQGPGIISV